MVKNVEGERMARNARFAVVLARFNGFIGEQLLAGAIEALTTHGVEERTIHVVYVPGAFEIPLALKTLAAGGKYDGLIALGAVIRGETPHFDYVAGECARGVAHVALQYDIPIGFGVLTTDTEDQAAARAGGSEGNKGADAALVAVQMVNLLKKLRA